MFSKSNQHYNHHPVAILNGLIGQAKMLQAKMLQEMIYNVLTGTNAWHHSG
jgi:hypothetical protein